MTYNAIVATIHTRTTPNADKLLLGDVLGFQVLVGIDTPDGALGVYFPTDGQLSPQFCEVHGLIGHTDPLTNKRVGGFFDEKRRVKTLRLRKEKSDGFWMPLSCLEFTGDISHLKEGDLFTEVNGIKICDKYYTESTLKAMSQKQGKPKKKIVMFPEHVDTEQFAYHKDNIKPGALITLTAKAHGTSHRMGNVLVYLPLSKLELLWNRVINKFWTKQTEEDAQWKPNFINKWIQKHTIEAHKQEYQEVHGTHHVVLGDIHAEGDGYYSENFRDKATLPLQGKLKKGEVIYFEIVGWANNTPIMKEHTITKEHKELWGKYPEKMFYSYGCLPGENKILIYRITQNNPDGHVTELSWRQVQKRAEELGVATVYEYNQFIFGDSGCWKCGCNDCEERGTIDGLQSLVEKLAENHPDPLDNRHIREGVVIRVDDINGTHFYKHKSFHFKLLEGIIKNDETVVDMEESS